MHCRNCAESLKNGAYLKPMEKFKVLDSNAEVLHKADTLFCVCFLLLFVSVFFTVNQDNFISRKVLF